MAVITKLREKMGRIVVFAIGFSIVSFVLADLLGPNSVLLGGVSNDVGVISGRTISLSEYQSKIDELTYQYSLNTGASPNSDQMYQIREQAWQTLINEIAFQAEFDELGIEVTDDEVYDMVQGKNVSPQIQAAFTNPETGLFDRSAVAQYFQQFSSLPPQQQAAWRVFEQGLGPTRLMSKYDNIFTKSNYINNEEARRRYQDQNRSAEVKYLYVPFTTIPDSAVNVTSSMLSDYLDDYSNRYQTEEYRGLKYVTFPVAPSAEDTALVRVDVDGLREDFINTASDSLFARANSEGTTTFLEYTPDLLPDAVASAESLEIGQVIGPALVSDRFVLYKVSKQGESENDYARASHILFKAEGDTDADKADARRRANNILREIRNGADFAEMARIHGTDGTASVGGDLGWFTRGRMVAPFEEAVMNAPRAGLLNRVVETDFGYHIIDVTQPRTNVTYTLAIVEKELYPSDMTRDSVFRAADRFAADSEDATSFETIATTLGLRPVEALRVSKNDRRVSSLNNARGIVTWLYNEASKDEVSEVFELENDYVVAVMTNEQSAGTSNLSNIENDIRAKVRNEEKEKQILAKLEGQDGTLEDLAAAYNNPSAQVNSMPSLKLSDNTLTGVGYAPLAVGVAFSLKDGERSKPFAVDNGLLIIEMVAISEPGEVDDFSTYRTQLEGQRFGRTTFNIDEAIKEAANIEDNRYKFF